MTNDSFIIDEGKCYKPIPQIGNYFEALQPHQFYIIIASGLAAVASVILFINTTSWITRNSPKVHIASNVILNSLYPIACLMSTTSIIVPRSYFFCDTISHIVFLICAYEMFSLFNKYVEGDSNLIQNKYTGYSGQFTVATPPCCCCLSFCIHPGPVSKRKILFVRWLIIQLGVVHFVLFVALNILQIDDQENFERFFSYCVPFIVVSIIFGIWGLNIMVRMYLGSVPENYQIKQKYFSLQLVLVFCKAQPAIIKTIGRFVVKEICSDRIIPMESVLNVYTQLAVSLQLLLLGYWASRLYRTPARL